MKRAFTSLLVSAATLSGCATAFKGKSTPVSVTSATPGATVSIDGRPAGVTPMSVDLSNKTDAEITVASNGKTETCRMRASASVGWVVADVLLTGGIGIIVDWATNNWNNVGPNSCHVGV
jgi:hypothetical protein